MSILCDKTKESSIVALSEVIMTGRGYRDTRYREQDCLLFKEQKCHECKECTYCGKKLFWSGGKKNIHHDHVKPWKKGGTTYVPSCDFCNLSKGSKTLTSWVRYLKTNNNLLFQRIKRYNARKNSSIALSVRKIEY
jgi:hypothetical protein